MSLATQIAGRATNNNVNVLNSMTLTVQKEYNCTARFDLDLISRLLFLYEPTFQQHFLLAQDPSPLFRKRFEHYSTHQCALLDGWSKEALRVIETIICLPAWFQNDMCGD